MVCQPLQLFYWWCVSLCAYSSQVLPLLLAAALLQYRGEIFVCVCVSSLVPRPNPAFHCLEYGKLGEGLATLLMWVMWCQDRKGVRKGLIVCRYAGPRTANRAKVPGNLPHISSLREANVIHTKCWAYSRLINTQNTLSYFCNFPPSSNYRILGRIMASPSIWKLCIFR